MLSNGLLKLLISFDQTINKTNPKLLTIELKEPDCPQTHFVQRKKMFNNNAVYIGQPMFSIGLSQPGIFYEKN
jgi:hypothetical protein